MMAKRGQRRLLVIFATARRKGNRRNTGDSGLEFVYWRVAQLAERSAVNTQVVGSSPTPPV